MGAIDKYLRLGWQVEVAIDVVLLVLIVFAPDIFRIIATAYLIYDLAHLLKRVI